MFHSFRFDPISPMLQIHSSRCPTTVGETRVELDQQVCTISVGWLEWFTRVTASPFFHFLFACVRLLVERFLDLVTFIRFAWVGHIMQISTVCHPRGQGCGSAARFEEEEEMEEKEEEVSSGRLMSAHQLFHSFWLSICFMMSKWKQLWSSFTSVLSFSEGIIKAAGSSCSGCT